MRECRPVGRLRDRRANGSGARREKRIKARLNGSGSISPGQHIPHFYRRTDLRNLSDVHRDQLLLLHHQRISDSNRQLI